MHGLLSFFLSVLALPPLNIPCAGVLAFVPWLLRLCRGDSGGVADSILLGGALSIYAFYGTLSVSLSIFTVCVTGVTLAFALVGAAVAFQARHIGNWTIAGGAASWAGALTVLGWIGIPASSALWLSPHRAWLLVASIIGGRGLDFSWMAFQIALALLVARWLDGPHKLRRLIVPGMTALALILVVFALHVTGFQPVGRRVDSHTVAIMQTDISGRESRFLSADGVLERVVAQRDRLVATLKARLAGRSALVLWPESSAPGLPLLLRGRLWRQVLATGQDTLMHAYGWNGHMGRTSAVYALQAGQHVPLWFVYKRLPVPLAEPDVLPGDGPIRPHRLMELPIGALICYEAALPGLARKLVKAGARLLVNFANDAYIGPSAIPALHAILARLRAIETGVPLVRAANGGPSAIYLPDGRTELVTPMFQSGVWTAQVAEYERPSLYQRVGIPLGLVMVLGGAFAMISALIVRRCRSSDGNKHNSTACGWRIAVASAAVLLLIGFLPRFIQRQAEVYQLQWRIADGWESGDSNGPPSLQYADVVSSVRPVAAALAMVLRELGEPVTTDNVPEGGEARRRWLSGYGLELAHVMALPGRLEAVRGFYGLIGYGSKRPQVLHVDGAGRIVIFDPKNARFLEITGQYSKWRELYKVRWIVPVRRIISDEIDKIH